MEYVIICLVALLGSALTFFSGFGLATLLVPVFAVFFPIDVAIGLTAIVHFLNNLFKLLLVGRNADPGVALRFGLPALLAAFAGAWVLTLLTGMQPLHEYELWGRHAAITPVKLTVAVLLAAFALIDLVPSLSAISFSRRYLPVGGLLSGFFGGLSGNQGALRSAFLIRIGLSKEAFVATGVVIAVMVDVARLSVYSQKIFAGSSSDIPLVAAATLSAFAGAYWGNKLLKKVTISALQVMVGVLLLVFALLLGAGVI